MSTGSVASTRVNYAPFTTNSNIPKQKEKTNTVINSQDAAKISQIAKEMATGSELEKVDTSRTAEQEKYSTTESRIHEGARLDAYLTSLRQQYSEEEAISRFNQYMESEGYEITVNAMRPPIGSKTNVKPYMVFSSSSFEDLGYKRVIPAGFGVSTGYGAFVSDRANENFTLTSSVKGSIINGATHYEQETWAQYDATSSADVSEIMDFWKSRNTEELSETAGFDIAKYLDDFTSTAFVWGKSFAAESVNTNLAGIINTVLASAGVTLESGQNMSLYLDQNEYGNYSGLNFNINFGDAALKDTLRSSLNQFLKDDPGILKAFIEENNKTTQYDVAKLPGTFDNGIQSNTFVQNRVFLLSGDQPSTMIMGSGLDNVKIGYTYRKKISDGLDLSADLITLNSSMRNPELGTVQRAKTLQLIDEIGKQRKK